MYMYDRPYMSEKLSDKIGKVFGRLTIVDTYMKRTNCGRRRRFAIAKCECGNTVDTNLYHITSGATVSCGCRKTTHGMSSTKEYTMFIEAKCRARDNNLPFSIEINDIEIPKVCPLLGIPIETHHTKIHDNSPTLDKLLPHLGYVPGNILVISNRANRIKSNATVDELMLLADNLHAILIE